MRLRQAQTLLFTGSKENAGGLTGFNFLTKSVFTCHPATISFLAQFQDWHQPEEIEAEQIGFSSKDIACEVNMLVDVDALLIEGSPAAQAEHDYLEQWSWGIPAAAYHFSLMDKPYLKGPDVEQLQRNKAVIEPSPALIKTNTEYAEVFSLSESLDDNDLLRLMASRRTVRETSGPTVTLKQLSDCLFAGMGIIGETRNCVCKLPLSMTPSGGARNPYEAYVYARAVEGLRPGFYHYSALEHNLGGLAVSDRPLPSELLAGQEWADSMPCIIFLVAKLERSMWKYIDPNAYRGVLIEAGHIGQNIMLAATQHGLSACPTAAFCHGRLHGCLGVEKHTDTAVYALTLGKPATPTDTVLYN